MKTDSPNEAAEATAFFLAVMGYYRGVLDLDEAIVLSGEPADYFKRYLRSEKAMLMAISVIRGAEDSTQNDVDEFCACLRATLTAKKETLQWKLVHSGFLAGLKYAREGKIL